MSEPNGGSPIQVAVVVLLLVGGGWYFFRNYEIDGLDGVSVYSKGELPDEDFVSYQNSPVLLGSESSFVSNTSAPLAAENPFATSTATVDRSAIDVRPVGARAYPSVKVASWALDGFGPTKLAHPTARRHVARIVREFDIVALQQIASIERDLVPRLVDAVNQGESRYDFVMGPSTGPAARQEQFAFIFDTTRVQVDRRQTYTVEDPEDQMTYDPLVAWFRAAKPAASEAWTFSLVNVRVDLARAPQEVALLPNLLASVRRDGRGEDDIVMLGLFQADDAYLLPTLGGEKMRATVRNRPTDIFGKYQTCNVLFDAAPTTEFLGRGGVYDFPRALELSVPEAETVTSHLPVYGEFTAVEGGIL